jgi:long-chain acyl-CoA synthetase
MVPRKDGSGYEESSYGELTTWSKHLAAGMQKHGIQPDDKVALISKPRLEWAIGFHAIFRCGAVAVPIDATLTPKEVERLFIAADVKWVLADGEWIQALSKVDGLKDRTSLEQFVAFDPVDVDDTLTYGELMADEGEPEPVSRKPSDLALLMCTSGTTGDSKAVMLTHENLSSNIANTLEVVLITQRDIVIEIAPWNHIFGVLVLIMGLKLGCKIIYTDDYRRLPELMAEQSVTILVGVPKLFHGVFSKLEQTLTASLLKNALYKVAPKVVGKKVIDRFGGKLRFMISGSAPLDPKVMQGLRRLGIGIIEGYGMTETSPVLSASTEFNEKYGSVGPAIPSLELKIDQPNDEGIGEVVVRGPNVTQGYYKNEDRTKETIDENGWLHTGDLGFLDSENWLYIKGRQKNVIVLESGKNVYPEELEFQFANIPEIAEVMATSGERKGVEIIKVFVYPDPEVVDASMPKDELKATIWQKIREESQQLAPFKRPKSESDLILVDTPFEKTSTLDIKRYLYSDDAS